MIYVFTALICVMLCFQSGVEAVEYLFVQTATGATLNGTLTLMGVASDVTYFSDRPVRVTGVTTAEEFLTLFEPLGTFSEVCGDHVRVMFMFPVTHAPCVDTERERM